MMEQGNDFLKGQIHEAVLNHREFLQALEDHEAQADDARFRDLCTRYITTMQDHQRMLEDYASEIGPPARDVPRSRDGAYRFSRDFADAVVQNDFQRLVDDSVMSARAEDAFRTFREAGRTLGLRHLAELGETGEREHDSYKRDANRLAQQMFVERARSDGSPGADHAFEERAY